MPATECKADWESHHRVSLAHRAARYLSNPNLWTPLRCAPLIRAQVSTQCVLINTEFDPYKCPDQDDTGMRLHNLKVAEERSSKF